MLDIILKDIKKHLLITLSIIAFAFISSFLIALGIVMSQQLLDKISITMEKAKTPHFLQMHAGDIDGIDFSIIQVNPDVEAFQILPFLNIDNNEFLVDGKPFIFSSDDNGVTIQGSTFDYLLSEELSIITPDEGIYVPTYYKDEVKLGSVLTICGFDFIVKGYLIDSQMGSSLSSSKRFLINEENYLKLRDYGREEYIIEIRAVDTGKINSISNLYALSSLPKDGPAVTYSLIKMMNALSDGMMIVLIIISGILSMLISLVALRYIFLISIEHDGKRIALFQAIGIRRKRIVILYSLKYFVLLLIGSLISLFALAIILKDINISSLILVHFIILLILTLWDYLITRNISKIDILDELRDSTKKSSGILSLILISVLSAFMYYLAFIPASASSTISDKDFVSSMGIGQADIRMDLKDEEVSSVSKYLESSDIVDTYELYSTYRVNTTVNGLSTLMLIEKGNHNIFPIKYIEGRVPNKEKEIALSQLLANELNVGLDDSVEILGESYRIVGLYGDITNGGKTAKVRYLNYNNPIWSIAYINSNSPSMLINDLNRLFSKAKTNTIENYINSLYGKTIESINKASLIAFISSLFIEVVLIVLITALAVERDVKTIDLKMAIGIRKSKLKIGYVKQILLSIIIGLLIGIILAITTGGFILSFMLSFLGGSGIEFRYSFTYSLLFLPFILLLIATLSSMLGLKNINNTKPFYLRGGIL